MTDVTTLLAGIKTRALIAGSASVAFNGDSLDQDYIRALETSHEDVPRLVAALEAVAGLHRIVKIYDECDCPENTHPEDYEWIDCEDYSGCENSLIGFGCEECCIDGDYLSQDCGENHTHTLDPEKRCPTITAVVAALGGGE